MRGTEIMLRIYSNHEYKKYRVNDVLQSKINACLRILIDNGVTGSWLCFLYKKDNVWYLRGGYEDLGFLSADNEDKEFKNLLIAVKKVVNQDFVGVVFPTWNKRSCLGGDFSIVLDDKSMVRVFDSALMTDETLGGRLYWFYPCVLRDGFDYYRASCFVYDRLRKKVYVPDAHFIDDTEMTARLYVLKRKFLEKWESGEISAPVYLPNGEKVECEGMQYAERELINADRRFSTWGGLPLLDLNTLSFKEEKLEDGTIRVTSLNSDEPEYFDIQEKGKDLVCTFTRVQGRRDVWSNIWVEEDYPAFPGPIIVGKSIFIDDELNINDGVLSGYWGAGIAKVGKKRYVDYKNGVLVSEKVNLREVSVVRWFELPKEYTIGYVLFIVDDEKITAELYMVDLRSERVSKVTTKSIPLDDIEEDSMHVAMNEYNCNRTLYYFKEKGTHSDRLIHVAPNREVNCSYNEKTKEFNLSYIPKGGSVLHEVSI